MLQGLPQWLTGGISTTSELRKLLNEPLFIIKVCINGGRKVEDRLRLFHGIVESIVVSKQ